jgi:hypothetical protein
MNEFFASIKADLTDRRLLPFVAAVCALLVAALAYALLAGSGGGAATPSSHRPTVPVPPLPTGIAVTGAEAQKAVAETPDGFRDQTHGTSHNPFTPLSGPAPASAAANAASSSSSSSTSSESSSSASGGESSSTPAPESGEPSSSGESQPKSKPKPKHKTVYDVSIKFGELPANTPPEAAQLTDYKKLKLQTPLPSAEQPLLVFRGVTNRGRAATFTLVGEAILTGTGACLPSPQQCQAVDLQPGQIEQLNYLQPDGTTKLYELRVLSISPQKAKASKAKASAARRHGESEGWGVSRAGQKVLREAGLVALPFLRYSSQPGVLVFAPPKAKKHPAHPAH